MPGHMEYIGGNVPCTAMLVDETEVHGKVAVR
jgi:hypothetical protein